MKRQALRGGSVVKLAEAVGRGSRALLVVSSVALVAMMVLVALDVVLRNTVGTALVGVTEYVSGWMMPLTVLFAMAITERRNEHMRVTLVEDGLSGRPWKVQVVGAQVLVVVISAVMTWSSVLLAVDSAAMREAVPMGSGLLAVWPIKVAIVVAWAWLTVQSLARLLQLALTDEAVTEDLGDGDSHRTAMEGSIHA